ncbi:alpha-tocopherol transfer protein-like [Mercenaria mercenaria]|uniref:alpha-tocopherol transfer protein-like n=1 Tax=Mercenaria mercenaria TaxID=6596 RepID=UPI00234FB58D|nr:alpha-tocopherol transfer protein-like [Mercenaria mercenaria]XP_045168286.2 alpha-tocopherol transfer protein-like [Mercenaria mercenaria]XP_045168287.2 alpha-tocopherol transfer protein-like [Mercenaria mercenaria]XP_045168288.2 alpha-tocopherol transfer protein-like [Mercenaria mercenaria]XP_045168289.2 alpha-tocopherol transfer protein-like [Mercenaria mercenaria]
MAAKEKDKAYVCTLSETVQKKAEEELFETPETRSQSIQILREKIEKCPELHIRTDDAYLLRFLRAKKFDCERAFQQIVRHFEVKCEKKNKELFSDMRPSAVKHVLEDGVTGVLPQRDKFGRRVLVFRPGRWDPSKYPVPHVFKTNFMTLSKLIEDEETQVSGIIMLADLKGVGFGHATQMTPFFAKRIVSLLQDTFPMRLKGVHYVNEPTVFDIVFAVARQFMRKKLLERVHVHGKNMNELAEFIDLEHLPVEYGGNAPPFSNEEWKNKLLACDAEFDEEAKYGFVKTSTEEKDSQPKQQTDDVLIF